MKTYRARLLIATVSIFCFAASAQAQPFGKVVQQECRDDYRTYCNEYGLDSAALRACMDRAGQSLSKGCVKALIQAGEVSQTDVDRRKKSGH